MQIVDEGQTDIKRNPGHTQCGKEFQHRRRQERDAQHAQRTLPQRVAHLHDTLGLCVSPAGKFQRQQPLQPIGEPSRQPAQRLGLAICGDLRPPADQRHEDRDQRCAHQEQNPCHPVQRQNDRAEHKRQQGGLQRGWKIASEVGVQCFHLVDDRG